MTAPFQCVKSTEKALATRAVPHMGAKVKRYHFAGSYQLTQGWMFDEESAVK
jgi:hypothetical protein